MLLAFAVSIGANITTLAGAKLVKMGSYLFFLAPNVESIKISKEKIQELKTIGQNIPKNDREEVSFGPENAVAIGANAYAEENGVAVGSGAYAGRNSVSIGANAGGGAK